MEPRSAGRMGRRLSASRCGRVKNPGSRPIDAMKTTATKSLSGRLSKSLFGRLWKKVLLVSGLAVVLLLVWVTARFNITSERSRPLAMVHRLFGFRQPASRAVADDLAIVGHRGSGSGIERMGQAKGAR